MPRYCHAIAWHKASYDRPALVYSLVRSADNCFEAKATALLCSSLACVFAHRHTHDTFLSPPGVPRWVAVLCDAGVGEVSVYTIP